MSEPSRTRLDEVHFQVDWPRDRPYQLVGFGLNAVDRICQVPHFPKHGGKVQLTGFTQVGGGQVATASALCARYGLRVRYVGRIGDDDVGRFSMQTLAAEAMDVSHVQTIKGANSQFAIILVDQPTGERTILWDRDAKLDYQPGEVKREWIAVGQVLHVDGHDQPACIEAARWALQAGMKVCLDIDKVQPGVEELLELIDFALPTANFLKRFTGLSDWRQALFRVGEATRGFVACTRGSEGCAALWEDEIHEVGGFPMRAVDTTGAGDVFHGAFVYALLQNWSVGRCLRFSNAAAALSVTRIGSRGGIPALEEVLRLESGIPPAR